MKPGGQAASGTSTGRRHVSGHSMNNSSATLLLAVDIGNTAVKLGCFSLPLPLPAADPIHEPLAVLQLDAQSWT